MYLALRKCKNECKILKISLVQIFVHLNLKLLDFLSDFVLICLLSFLMTVRLSNQMSTYLNF